MFMPKKNNLASLADSIERLVLAHSELSHTVKLLQIAGNEQRELLEEMKGERDLYANAFGLAVGKLCAHLGYEADSEQTTDLVREILSESNT